MVDASLRVIVTHDGPTAGWTRSYLVTPKIKSVRIKSPPLVGKVVDLRWEGEDLGLGIIDRLNGDISIKQRVVMSQDVTICAVPDHRC